MSNFRNLLILIFLSCSMLSFVDAFAQHQNEAYRSFWHPTYLGKRLDYCTFNGRHCGKAVANRFCQMLGYDYASQNVIAHNVGLTHYLDCRAECKGWRCNGFMTISCATSMAHKPPKPYHYREKIFAAPRYNNYRVDWCYDRKVGCGARAAHSFCNRMGFMQAKRYVKQTQVAATQAIGNQELCFGNQCTGFKMIVCYR